MNKTCLFCKIINGQIPAKKIAETEHVLVIEDIAPKAPIHFLILPKNHLANLCELTQEFKEPVWKSLLMACDLSKKWGSGAFNLISNNGEKAGQSVFHLHWHFLSGKPLASIAREGL